MKLTHYQIAALGVLLLNIVYLSVMYNGLPDIIPDHFNIKGKADGFGPKRTLLIITAIGALVFLIMYAVTSSGKYNLPKSISIEAARKSLGQLTVSTQIIFLLISYSTITSGLERHNPIEGWAFPIILALVLLPTLSMFSKSKTQV